jgi:4-amino-4-deoxy-L-arabinose transferase-like glycosyltransferase
LLFLWLEKTALTLFGPSEHAVHLLPFLAGLAGLAVFWRLCRSAFTPTVAGFAIAILAVSYYPVRHGAEVKPYAFDLLFAILFASLTFGHWRNPQSWRWLAALALTAPIAVFSSYPSVFVGGAVSMALLPSLWTGTWMQRLLYVAFNVMLCGSFVAHYAMVAQPQVDVAEAERTREFLREYWKDAFPPDSAAEWPLWLVRVFTGNMLAHPIGANRGGSTLNFVLVLLGSFALFQKRDWRLLALCWLPFALNLIAATMRKYPFGDSARITLHLTPFICILMAHGLARIVAWIRSPTWQTRIAFSIYAILITCGSAGVTRDLVKPYKTEHDRDVRRLVHDLRRQVECGAPVLLCHGRDEELIAEFAWYMRTQDWQIDWANRGPGSARSCWLILCANHEPNVAEVVARAGPFAQAWSITASDVRHVPPENNKMPPMHCRWVHLAKN